MFFHSLKEKHENVFLKWNRNSYHTLGEILLLITHYFYVGSGQRNAIAICYIILERYFLEMYVHTYLLIGISSRTFRILPSLIWFVLKTSLLILYFLVICF